MIWPIDDPTGTHPSEGPDDAYCASCLRDQDDIPAVDCARPGWHGDDIERANLDAATRADEGHDERHEDYDGPEWPF